MSGEMEVVYGVIGGSGLYEFVGPDREEDVEPVLVRERRFIKTPFGYPSSDVVRRIIDGKKVFFLARHGYGHALNPSEVPYRANIYALRELGVTVVLSVSAVGSLREEMEPGHMVIPDQLFDRTKDIRSSTFFENGIVAHAPFAEPYCAKLRMEVLSAAQAAGVVVHNGGTLVCMEGPQFSTKAESLFYRNQGFHLIGMTALPEAKLAREAGMCYATLALVTDYDCWYEGHGAVTADAVIKQMKKNAVMAVATLTEFFKDTSFARDCNCSQAMVGAFATDPDTLQGCRRSNYHRLRKVLDVICGDHLPKLKEE